MAAWTVMLRGIRYRAGRSLAVFFLAVAATTAAVLAPAYSRAAQQSVLTDELRAAPADATGLVISARGTAEATPAAFGSIDETRLTINDALHRQPAVADRLGRPVGAVDTDATTEVTGTPLATRLAYRDDVCAQLRITGSCPVGSRQVLVSDRSAQAHGIDVGDRLTLRPGNRSEQSFTVVGRYTPKDPGAAYWGPTVYFPGGAPEPVAATERIDALFAGDEDDVRLDRAATVWLRVEYPLRPGAVRLDDLQALRVGLSRLANDLRTADLEMSTALPAALDGVEADRRAIGRTVPVIAVSLLLLCWFVLFLLVAALIEERGPEIGLAKLRGFPAGQAARFGLAEGLLPIALAAPFGLAAGLGVVEVAARTVLAAGTHAEARWPVFVAAGGALLGGLVAALAAGRATLRRPVLGLLRRVPQRGRWRAGLAEGIVVGLAAAALFAALGDRAAPLALLAPPLIALVAGVAAGRLVVLWSRLRLAVARRRGRLPALLSAAQLARRPGGQRVVAVVAVAVALLMFAAIAWDAAAQARRRYAEDALGAARVYTVRAEHPSALVAAVAAADAGGRSMAAVRAAQRYGDSTVHLLGVQAARLPDVALWPGYSRAQVARLAAQLRPRVAEPLALDGDVAVDVGVDALPATLPVRLAAIVAAPGEPPRTVQLGLLGMGGREYRAPLPACPAGCRLLALAVGRAGEGIEPLAVVMQVRAIRSGGKDLPAGFDRAGRWRLPAHPSGQVQVTPGAALGIEVSSSEPADAVVEYVDVPDALPAVLAGDAPDDDPAAAAFGFPGFAEQPQPFAVVGRVDRLPRAGDRGLLFDLEHAVRMAERTASLADNEALRYEVWAAVDAPADLAARLAGAGVQVLRNESVAGYVDRLARRAPALALRLYLLAGAAAIVLAVGVVLLTGYVGVGGRLYEFAALEVAGVPRRVLRGALLREYRGLLVPAMVVGLAAGAAGALMMLPGLPLVTADGPAGAIVYRPGPGTLAVAVGVTLAGFGVAVLLVLRVLRRATPQRLRDGPS